MTAREIATKEVRKQSCAGPSPPTDFASRKAHRWKKPLRRDCEISTVFAAEM